MPLGVQSSALLFFELFELFVDLLSPLPWREMSRVDERPPRYSGLEILREKTDGFSRQVSQTRPRYRTYENREKTNKTMVLLVRRE